MNEAFWDKFNSVMGEMAGGALTAPEQCRQMAQEVFTLRPAISMEIGVWRGIGLVALAMAHKEINHGKVIGIDPWSATAYPPNEDEPLKALTQADWDITYDYVLECLDKTDTRNFVEIWRSKSDDVPPPDGIGFLRIDGDHGACSMRDVTRFCPKVITHGVLHLDDITWTNGAGSLGALDYLRDNGWIETYRTPTGAAYRKG